MNSLTAGSRGRATCRENQGVRRCDEVSTHDVAIARWRARRDVKARTDAFLPGDAPQDRLRRDGPHERPHQTADALDVHQTGVTGRQRTQARTKACDRTLPRVAHRERPLENRRRVVGRAGDVPVRLTESGCTPVPTLARVRTEPRFVVAHREQDRDRDVMHLGREGADTHDVFLIGSHEHGGLGARVQREKNEKQGECRVHPARVARLLLVLYTIASFAACTRHEPVPGLRHGLSFAAFGLRLHAEDVCTIGWVREDRLPRRCWKMVVE